MFNFTSFDTLWKMMWGNPMWREISGCNQYKNEENISQKKFEMLKVGLPIGENNEICSLEKFVYESTSQWNDPEWEFPKGRRNFQEKDLDCAIREFEEETGISRSNIQIVKNLMAFEEIFVGSNHKSYKHKYFLAYTDNDNDNKQDNLNNFQTSEVSKLEWKTLEECLDSIRPYNIEKKKLITNINRVLQEYRLY